MSSGYAASPPQMPRHQCHRGQGRDVTSTATAQPDGQSLPPIDDPSMWRRFRYGMAHPMDWLRAAGLSP